MKHATALLEFPGSRRASISPTSCACVAPRGLVLEIGQLERAPEVSRSRSHGRLRGNPGRVTGVQRDVPRWSGGARRAVTSSTARASGERLGKTLGTPGDPPRVTQARHRARSCEPGSGVASEATTQRLLAGCQRRPRTAPPVHTRWQGELPGALGRADYRLTWSSMRANSCVPRM